MNALGMVKVTLNLPKDLVRELKLRAVREKRKLSEIAEEVFLRGVTAPEPGPTPKKRHRAKLPIVPAPAGAKPFNVTGEGFLELEQEVTPFGVTPQLSDSASAER